MKTTIKGYPINRNGKIITNLVNEVIRAEYLGKSIKQNGEYLFFRFKRRGKFVYSY